MSNYEKLFRINENLYAEGSPVLIRAGALFRNEQTGRLHVQVKFENLCKKPIVMLKASFVFADASGKELYRDQHQFMDIKAAINETFGDKTPVLVQHPAARSFTVTVEDVWFLDGETWTNTGNAPLGSLPKPAALGSKFLSKEAIAQFKSTLCLQANFVPFKFKDVWFCSCGNINKEQSDRCARCGAPLNDMLQANEEKLKQDFLAEYRAKCNQKTYEQASSLAREENSASIKEAIRLFESLHDYKDSAALAEKEKAHLESVEKLEQERAEQERAEQERIKAEQAKRNKKIFAVASSIIAAIVLIIIIGVAVSTSQKDQKYALAQGYISQGKCEQAISVLNEIKGYKDADKMYSLAQSAVSGDYKSIITAYNLTEFTVPSTTDSIAASAFFGCTSLKSITIHDGVTSIGESAFEGCSSLTNITIPESVTSIGRFAFYNCSGLTSIT
ncbi:MAG: leucine-rich repeat protein, partial [Candidatus Neoclostridium sp.]